MSDNLKPLTLEPAIRCLKQGKIIAYPTESVYGLGCDPFNEKAVAILQSIKQRPSSKGLILIASSWHQIEKLIQPLEEQILTKVRNSWPGPITWVFPAASDAPKWLISHHQTLALRITAHPIAKALCSAYGGAIISTSANLSGNQPATTAHEVDLIFGETICAIIDGQVGHLAKPTPIRDVITGDLLRE